MLREINNFCNIDNKMANCITLDSTGQILRWGNCDFENDGSYNSSLETYTAACGALIEGLKKQYTKIVAGVCTEMIQTEKDAVDAAAGAAMLITPVPALISIEKLDTLESTENIKYHPSISKINSYTTAISLEDGDCGCRLKKVLNRSGATISVNATLDGNTQLQLTDGNDITLLYVNNVWTHFDGADGITFS